MASRNGGLIDMCIAFPGVVVEVDAFGAVVETDGRRRRASTLFLPDIAVGEWVAVAAGTIVERLEPEHAAEIQEILRAAIAAEAAEATGRGTAAPLPLRVHLGTTPGPRAEATGSTPEGAPDVHSI